MAVDMWSVGCVTTALLAGRSYFVNTQDSDYRRNSSAAIIKAAAECNLDRLDHSSAWLDVDQHAKHFVKSLLVLDEKARLTVETALEHLWFMQGSRQLTLADEYQKIIEGWKRWSPGWDFVTHLDCFIEARIPQTDVACFLSEVLTIANEEQPRRSLYSAQKEKPIEASCQLQRRLQEQLRGPNTQNVSRERNTKIDDSSPLGPLLSVDPRKLTRTVNRASGGKQRQSIPLGAVELSIYAELEDYYGPRDLHSQKHLSSGRDDQVSSHYFSETLRKSSPSISFTARRKPEEDQELSTPKRRRTTFYDFDEAAICTEAGKESRTRVCQDDG